MNAANKPRSRWVIVIRLTLIGAALAALFGTLRRAELGRAAALALGIGPKIVLALVPFGIAMTLQTAGYARILNVIRGSRASFLRLLSVMLSSEAVLMSVPAGAAIAETIHPYLLKRRLGIPTIEGIVAVATKKVVIVFTNGVYIGLGLLLGAGYLRFASRALTGTGLLPWLVLASAVAMLVAAAGMSTVLFSGSLAARLRGVLRRLPSARLRAFLDDREGHFTETDARFARLLSGNRSELAVSAALVLGCWLVEGAETLVILRLLGVDMPFAEVLAFEVVVSLLRSLAFMVPAGIGVQDAGYVAFLSAFGVPDAPTLGVAFVLVKRAKEIFYVAVGLSLLLLPGDASASREGPSPSLTRA